MVDKSFHVHTMPVLRKDVPEGFVNDASALYGTFNENRRRGRFRS